MKIPISRQQQQTNCSDDEAPKLIIKQSTFKLKLFSINKKKDKSEIKGEKEAINRMLYKCPYCDKGYTSVTRYEVHFRTHTGEKPYGCKFCPKKFNEKGNLKTHLRIHTGERPFYCTFPKCGMAFKTKGQLNDHAHRHSDFRPFKCPMCQSTFNRKTRLKVHLMIHSGKKPYKCSFPRCSKDFREKGNLTSHMKKHLNEIRDAKEDKQSQGESKESTISIYGWMSNCYQSNINSIEEEEELLNLVNPRSLLIEMMYEPEAQSNWNGNNVFQLNDFNLDEGLTDKTNNIID